MKILKFKDNVSWGCILASIYFVCMPLTIIPLPMGISLLKMISYLVGLIFIITLVIREVELKFNIVHFFLAVYIIYTFSSLLQLNDEGAWISIRGMLQTGLITFLISTRVYNKTEKGIILFSWILVGIISIIFSFTSSQTLAADASRETIYILGGWEDPNQFCGYFLLPVLLFIDKMLEKNKLTPFYLVAIILTIYAVSKTGSRGGLIAVLITVFLHILLAIKGIGNKIKVLLALIFVSVFFMVVLFPLLPEELTQRFTIQAVEQDRGSGRFIIWKTLLDAIFQSPKSILFGYGIGSTVGILKGQGFVNTVAHNHWIQIWCDQGFVGMTMFTLVMASGFFRNYKKYKVISISMLGMIVLSMSLTLYAVYKPFWNVILMSAMNLNED